MLSLSRGLRLALVLAMSLGHVAWQGQLAFADDDDDEDEGEERGGDDEEEEEEDAKDQPPITAGGLFNLKTFPVRELFRPLTMTEGITQIRLGLGVDVSDKTAFEYFGAALDVRHGMKDNFTVLGGFSGDYNFKQFNIYAGFEGALAYDLINIRTALSINRPAAATMFDMETGKPTEYSATGVQASLDLGFPFRYVAKPEIAIVALDTLISFDFNAVNLNGVEVDGIKPDLNPSLGISTNPIASISVVIFAQLQIKDFDTTNKFTVPATARIQFSPNQRLDIGGEFKFLDMKPPVGEFYDNRFLTLYVQSRFGR